MAHAATHLSTNSGLRVHHELLRNVTISGDAACGDDACPGVVRKDKRCGAGGAVGPFANREAGLNLAHNFYKNGSDGTTGTLCTAT